MTSTTTITIFGNSDGPEICLMCFDQKLINGAPSRNLSLPGFLYGCTQSGQDPIQLLWPCTNWLQGEAALYCNTQQLHVAAAVLFKISSSSLEHQTQKFSSGFPTHGSNGFKSSIYNCMQCSCGSGGKRYGWHAQSGFVSDGQSSKMLLYWVHSAPTCLVWLTWVKLQWI